MPHLAWKSFCTCNITCNMITYSSTCTMVINVGSHLSVFLITCIGLMSNISASADTSHIVLKKNNRTTAVYFKEFLKWAISEKMWKKCDIGPHYYYLFIFAYPNMHSCLTIWLRFACLRIHHEYIVILCTIANISASFIGKMDDWHSPTKLILMNDSINSSLACILPTNIQNKS